MRPLTHQLGPAWRALAAAYLDGAIRFWMWLLEATANGIVACINPLIGQIAFLYLMSQMRSAIVSFGRWGGIYAGGTYAYRVCLGFIAITWLPIDVDEVLLKLGRGRPRHLGLSVLLSHSERRIGRYPGYALRAWGNGHAVAVLLADIDEILVPQPRKGGNTYDKP